MRYGTSVTKFEEYGRTPDTIWVNVPYGYEIMISVKMPPVRDSERFVCDRILDGSPDVDDTHTSL